ncbi:uncharacterized protein [Triticum aestivum]|uniref:uncharacterized protein isoform X1 n=1 Tax=Triticum aestivum TaxID=4565 RepID=UPI001D02B31B|nr:uncharacterized protein LOC123128601 isoform X1 [Triticum aestivum]XP_044404575.1 uncharacterized protein LOC123128601 isoform X1 [Triticum aestivum]
MGKGQKIVLPACRGHLPTAPPPSSAPPCFPTACRCRRNPTSHIEKWWRAGCEAASPHHFCRLPQKQDAQVHLLYAFQYIYFPMLDPGGASSCWLELGCKRVDGSMPHKHCAMLSPTTWLQGGRVRRDHQFRDLRHCSCRYHGHLHHCVISQQPPAQGKATGVEASEMLFSGEVADYGCQFVILWPQCTYVSFSGRSMT